MRKRSPSQAQIRRQVEQSVLEPIFEKISTGRGGFAVPEIVVKNRIDRAQRRLSDALVVRGSANVPKQVRLEVADLVRQ